MELLAVDHGLPASPARAGSFTGSVRGKTARRRTKRDERPLGRGPPLATRPAPAAIRAHAAIRLQSARAYSTVNHMVHYQARLDATFAALSDVTRRGVLEHLGGSEASITDLAEKFHMTLTGMKKHVSVLEQAGLVTTEKVGRVRTCKLGQRRLEEEAAWIERHRQLWSARFDALDQIVEQLKREEKADAKGKRR
ncbi:metalloregulator ArsR/SmtB family transcription factor [Lysobacter sp. Root667]|nr:metalloregulator ArsR/SmtB family transcription factor [Lysobacter sp. Root667]